MRSLGAGSSGGEAHTSHSPELVPPGLSRWVRAHDPGLSALRRSLRAAVITPSLFALSSLVIGSPTMAIFSAFAPFVLMMFVDFGGPMRERVAEQTALVLASTFLVCVGTLIGQTVWLAGIATFVIAFVILFSGILSSALAGATTSLLISLVLPATLKAPVSSLPERIAGWTLGGAATIVAVAVMWPRPPEEPLRTSTARVCATMARQLRAEALCAGSSSSVPTAPVPSAAVQETTDAVATVRRVFLTAPHRPTGLSTTARALVRLVDRVVWLGELLKQTPSYRPDEPAGAAVGEVHLATAVLLEHGASDLLASETARTPRPGPSPPPHPAVLSSGGLAEDNARLASARARLEAAVTSSLPVRPAVASTEPPAALVGSLLSGFRAQRMSFVAAAIATDIDVAVSARRRTWWQRLCGHRPAGAQSDLSSARQRLAEHLNRHSVWLHNSVRGAVALAIGVVLAQVSGVDHAFWVVFGTLAVLRTNAVNTGQTVGRALLGTALGFVVGVAFIVALGSHPVVLWLLLPPAIVLVGLEPSVTSFTAGQAGFTVVLLILFTIIQPVGWRVGLVRVQDMALGCAVSLVVGLLFWPRGAGSALGQALCEAFGASSRYVRAAVGHGLTQGDPGPFPRTPVEEQRRATASARRLDDAFRGYLAERGTKRIALPDVVSLVNTVAALRLTGDAVTDLWSHADRVPRSASTASQRIVGDCDSVLAWFETSGRALAGLTAAPAHLLDERVAGPRLWEALRRDLAEDAGEAAASAAVREIWTADHLDMLRHLQTRILRPVKAAAEVTAAGTRS